MSATAPRITYQNVAGTVRVECDGPRDYALFLDDNYAGSFRTSQAAIDEGDAWETRRAEALAADLADEQAERDAEEAQPFRFEAVDTCTGKTIDKATGPVRSRRLADVVSVDRVLDTITAMDFQPEETDGGRRWTYRNGWLLVYVYENAAEVVEQHVAAADAALATHLASNTEVAASFAPLVVAEILDSLVEAVDTARAAAGDNRPWQRAIDAAWDWLLQQDSISYDAATHALRVESATRPGRVYEANGSCSCEAFAKGGACWHRAAARLVRRALEARDLATPKTMSNAEFVQLLDEIGAALGADPQMHQAAKRVALTALPRCPKCNEPLDQFNRCGCDYPPPPRRLWAWQGNARALRAYLSDARAA